MAQCRKSQNFFHEDVAFLRPGDRGPKGDGFDFLSFFRRDVVKGAAGHAVGKVAASWSQEVDDGFSRGAADAVKSNVNAEVVDSPLSCVLPPGKAVVEGDMGSQRPGEGEFLLAACESDHRCCSRRPR